MSKRKQRSIYLTDETYNDYKLYCDVMGLNSNEEVEKMIIEYMDDPEIQAAMDTIKKLKEKKGD